MHITDRLYEKKWGIFTHYLANEKGERNGILWNDAVNSIDVKKLAKTLHDIGAGYYFITLMQGRRYMLTPNKTFDSIAGTLPGEACSTRDVVLELYDELSKYDIDLYLYFTSDGPHADDEIGPVFGFTYDHDEVWNMQTGVLRPPEENKVLSEKRLTDEYIQKWVSVLEEYAVRYGDKIKGWWMDGFFPHFGFNNENMKPFYDAIKRGNPDAVVAFNSGVHPTTVKWYENEEFTAGEFNDLEYIPNERFVNGAQNHILAPLGKFWGKPDANRYDKNYMKKYIDAVNSNGGVVSIDIAINCDGSFSPEQIEALSLLK